jgi:threonine synthase
MSAVQRRQMSTINADNVFALRINGTFDDCQDLVKLAFKTRDFLKPNQYLLAVNSINWTRIIGQICYYFYTYNQLNTKGKLSFSIPTGNFGNVFACYSAHKMGLPVNKICVAVNKNDILHRFFTENDYSKKMVHDTLSPSMDISVASNFERLVYDFFLERSGEQCADMFNHFPNSPIVLSDAVWQKKDSLFSSSKVEDLNTKQIINKIYKSYGYVLDPHTAVAADEAFKKSNADNHFIILATAHPAKFPKVYEELQIKLSSLPKGLHDLEKKKEYLHTFNANYNDIKDFIKLNN